MKNLNKMILVLSLFIASCSNKELESRIVKSEGKVTDAEVKDVVRKSVSSPASVGIEANRKEEKPTGPLPAFTFEEETYDFGEVNAGEVLEHTFNFTNSGEAPLIITNATSTCGCTIPEWPREPIPIGGSGRILVKFNTKNKKNVQNKPVILTANTYPKKNTLRIKAFVKAEENPS